MMIGRIISEMRVALLEVPFLKKAERIFSLYRRDLKTASIICGVSLDCLMK